MSDAPHGVNAPAKADAAKSVTTQTAGTAARDLARIMWFSHYPVVQTVASFVLAIFASAAFSLDPTVVSKGDVVAIDPTASGALFVAYEVLLSFSGHYGAVPLMVLACLLTLPIRYVYFGRRDSWRPSTVLPAVLFAGCMVVGSSYDFSNQADAVVGNTACLICSCLSGIGWGLVAHVGIYLVYECFDWLGAHRIAFSRQSHGRLWSLLDAVLNRHPFAVPLAVLVVLWLSALIASMPGTFMGDTGTQIRQWFNLPSGTSDYLNLINPKVLLNGHHPVVHTAILGTCVQLGINLFGDCNAGLFIYTVLQYAVTCVCLSYAMSGLKRLGISLTARGAVFAFMLFMPLFSSYVVLATKDIFFADAVLVMVVQTAKVVARGHRGEVTFGACDIVAYLLAALGCTFMRNGGVVFPLATCTFAALSRAIDARRSASALFPHAYARAVAVFAVALVCVAGNWYFSSVFMPAHQITPGSKREVLSIPFQQTARFVQKHDSAHAGVEGGTSDGLVTDEERAVIDKVLGYSDLASRYNPNKSDAVKNGYNESASAEDLRAYFKVWAQMFIKDPECYVSAFIGNYYGYFYPSAKAAHIYNSVTSTKRMSQAGNRQYFDFHRSDNPATTFFDHVVNLYRTVFQCIPLLSLTLSSAVYVWLMLVCVIYLLRGRRWHQLVLWVPLLGVLGVCLIGPCNGATYLRYLYPAIFAMPFVFAITFTAKRFDRDSNGALPLDC